MAQSGGARKRKYKDILFSRKVVLLRNDNECTLFSDMKKIESKSEIEFSSSMTQNDVQKKIQETFPYLEYKRFSCAAFVKVDNDHKKFEFHGSRRVWDGITIKKQIRGKSNLYILEEEVVHPISTVTHDSNSTEDCSNRDLQREVIIEPQKVPLQGGENCLFHVKPELPPQLSPAFATFGDLGTIELTRLNDSGSLIGNRIPPNLEPGWVTVSLRTESGIYLGETNVKIMPFDERRIKEDLVSKLAISTGGQTDAEGSETENSITPGDVCLIHGDVNACVQSLASIVSDEVSSQDADVVEGVVEGVVEDTRQRAGKSESSSYETQHNFDLVPTEIFARGPLYVQAYNKAIQEGVTRVVREPIMIIGQARSGKTSLKNSLQRKLFNEKEESTDGIEVHPSYFSVNSEVLTTGETDQEPDSDSEVSFHNRVAECMVDKLKGETVNLESSHQASVGNNAKSEESDINMDTHAPARDGIDKQTQEQKLDEEEIQEKHFKQEVPQETAACLAKKLQESKREDEDKVYSILWDFGGQSVYYATHPIFLTPKAIYLLVYDLSKNPHDRATPIVNEGVFKQKKDHHCRKTNEDYLHFWLSSVSSLESGNMSHTDSSSSGKLPKKLPPVILVCTHADQCDHAKEVAREIYGSLRKTTFGDHLSKTYFVVDNTKSGSADECPGVKHLKNELFAVAKQLPHMKQTIPIKWLSFEEALKNKIDKGEPFIVLDEARRVARDECGIDDDEQFDTLLKFLHDQRILIHFDDTPKLNDMVILDPQWLVNLFRKVITVKRYDPTTDEEQHEELWEKLETDGILDDELLRIVWGPLLNNETKESLIEVMEKFTLLCHLPSMKDHKQYLVPSMLMSHPDEVATKLLEANFIPPLFIRFRRPRLLRYTRDTADVKSIQEHVQVPLGLFPRLVVKFLQLCIKDGFRPVYENMYQDFARFPIHPKGYSVILRCHSSSVEIVLYRGPDASSDTTDVKIGYVVRDQLESMLQSLGEECFWLNTMEWEFSVICPVCCKQRSVRYCHKKHRTSGCEREECLHFWSESQLQDEQYCLKDTFAKQEVVPVKEFVPWFGFLKTQVQSLEEFGHSFGDSVVKDMIVRNVHVMDELACGLDQESPFSQYWVHLADEFSVPEDVIIEFQYNSECSPSKNMLAFQAGRAPYFTVSSFKDGLRDISRNDLVKKLERCNLPETATLKDLSGDHPETFESICLQLDHGKNWKALGKKFSIPKETLQQIETSSSFGCTKAVLETIEKKNPNLSVNEIRDVLKDMLREDACNVLDNYLREDNSTIATLLGNQDCLEEVTTLLDKETPGLKNWRRLAWRFGVSKYVCDYLKPKENPSPTRKLMEYIIQVDPDLTVNQFIQTLIKMQRMDVVNSLKKLFCDPSTTKQSLNRKDTEGIEEGLKNLCLC